jgi:plastocyanin
MNSIVNTLLFENFTTFVAVAIFIFISLPVSSIASPLSIYSVKIYAEQQQPQPLAGTTFPPPIFYKLRNIPSYAITIPFSSPGFSNFDPSDVSIPIGMTIIWFNDDSGLHTVTTTTTTAMTNSSSHFTMPSAPPQKVDSGSILPNGGSFIHTFSEPGTYNYYDKFDPRMHGRINVGTGIESGKNMNMMVGGNLSSSFNPNEARKMVLSFVPKTIPIPPTVALTYEVTISNTLRPWLVFSHIYDDSDGMLDLELIPTHRSKNNSADFTTWGPDFRSQEAFHTTGTYHLKGPLLVENSEYDIRIAIIAKDGIVLSKPVVDTFILLPAKAVTTSSEKIAADP